MVRDTAVRRSPFLVTYWEGGTHWVHSYLTGRRFAPTREAMAALEHAGGWIGRITLLQQIGESRAEIIDELIASSLLESADQPQSATATSLHRWERWSPSAAFFHAVSKTMRPAGRESEDHRGHLVMIERDFPPSFKQYPGEAFPLPRTSASDALEAVLAQRRTWREFGERPLALQELATLLGLTFGVQRWIRVGDGQWVAMKSSPSGGARHSIEAYVLALDVEGLDRGTYYYCPDSHSLTSIDRETTPGLLESLVPTQPGFHGAKAVILTTAVFERMQWKYSHPHAYRVIMMDVGHLSQTFALVATDLSLAPFCTAALDYEIAERHLDVDGVSESVVLLLGVGARPDGKQWSPMHDRSVANPATRPPTRSAARSVPLE